MNNPFSSFTTNEIEKAAAVLNCSFVTRKKKHPLGYFHIGQVGTVVCDRTGASFSVRSFKYSGDGMWEPNK